MNSVRRRLLLGLGLSLVLVLGSYGAWSLWRMRTLAESYVLTRLAHDAESLLAELTFDPQGRPHIDETAIPRIYRRAFSGHYFFVASPGGTLASRSLWGHPLPHADVPVGQVEVLRMRGPLDQRLLLRRAGYRKNGRPLTLVVAEDITQVEAQTAATVWQLALWLAGGLLVMWWVQRRIVTRGLAPLEYAQRQVRELQAGRRERLDESVVAEVRPLVQEINRLVEHLEGRLRRSREALGNLAHALKGPLSVLAQLCEGEALRADPEAQASCRAAVEGLRQRIERELKRARLAGEGAGSGVFDAAAELADLLRLMERVHERRGLRFELRVPEGSVFRLDREDALEILGNLVDNAAKWARETVRVTVEAAGHLVAVVEDDGPGVPEAAIPGLLRRGTRLDEQAEGHGLGLAIVREAVRQYRGELTLGRSPLGGLQARVSLPGAPRLPRAPAPGAGAGGASG